MAHATARQEWAAAWPLPMVGMLGIAGSAAFAYSGGIFMEPMIATFGWSRTQFSTAFVIQMLAALMTLPVVGRLAHRFGPRRIVLLGICTFTASFALLGSVGSIAGWYLLCVLLTIGVAGISQVVWVSALVGHFRASRGLAISLALAGLGVGTVIWPPLALLAIRLVGWRLAFGAMALPWAAIMLPLTFAFFRDPPRAAPPPPRSGQPVAGLTRMLASPDFICLLLAGGLFSGAYYGVAINLVPILKAGGIDVVEATGVASSLGVFAIIGRPVVGQLLDRLPTRPIAIGIFLLPSIAVAILLYGGTTILPAIAASAVLGFSAGGEMDVVTFIAAGRFGQDRFAALYAVLTAILAVFASLGPLTASILFDATGSYRPYLFAVGAATLVGVVLMAIIPAGTRQGAEDALAYN